jgi:hypothetical protein
MRIWAIFVSVWGCRLSLHIWSFEEIMRHYNVWQLAHAIEMLQDMQTQGDLYMLQADINGNQKNDLRVPDERMNTLYVPELKYIQAQCEYLELPAALARIPHFNNEIRQGITWAELRTQAKVLHEAIHADLCYRRFAFVPTSKAQLHDTFALVWDDIWKKIPDCKEDSERAIDCYALEQNTACVFHLMRVTEFGLRSLAKKLRVTITHSGKACPLEYGDWEKVIAGIKNKIAQIRSTAAGPKKQAKLEFYSDAADHCVFMKDIWRNNVSHTRKAYNDSEAKAALDRVQDFMRFLSAQK